MSEQSSKSQNFILFNLNNPNQIFGLNVLKIKEIIKYKHLNSLPESNSSVVGVTELRGESLPVIDLSLAMGYQGIDKDSDDGASIVITEFNRKVQGFLVKNVDNIISVNWADIKPIPKASGGNHYVTGVVEVNKKLVSLIDVEKVMHETTDLNEDFTASILSKTQLNEIKGKFVFAVDDSRIARTKISQTLDALGVDYQMSYDGFAALAQIKKLDRHVDLIISDIEMPEVDGYTFAKNIRSLPKPLGQTKILLHTSLVIDEGNNNFQESGANSLLTKFDVEELSKAIYSSLTT